MKDFSAPRRLTALHRIFNWLQASCHEKSRYLLSFLKPISSVSLALRSHCSQIKTSSTSNFPDQIEAKRAATTRLLLTSFYLREPIGETLKLLKGNSKILQQVEELRNQRQTKTVLVRHLDNIQLPQENQFLELNAADTRARIVVSFHFGDFVYGLHKLLSLQEDTSSTAVLSQKKSTEQYLENMAIAFGKQAASSNNQFLLGKTKIRDLLVFLRRPQSRLMMFADLPSEYGETVEVIFLGRKANFSRSIALLALASKAPILPVVCVQTEQGQRVELGRQIEPKILIGETRSDAAIRITQQQITFFEHFFIRQKAQWRYLRDLPNYFVKEN